MEELELYGYHRQAQDLKPVVGFNYYPSNGKTIQLDVTTRRQYK
jgi:hypothetical protein